MNLTPIQLYCQEKLILASHPWLSLEETKKKEFRFYPWCKAVRRKNWYTTVLCTVISTRYDMMSAYIHPYNRRDYSPIKISVKDIEQIIWLPPTLPRVLNALGSRYKYAVGWIYHILTRDEDISWRSNVSNIICNRKLLNSDWTDATLRDQSEDTQRSIALLLWWKDVPPLRK